MNYLPEQVIKQAFPKEFSPRQVSMPQEYLPKVKGRTLSFTLLHEEYGWLFKGPQHSCWVAYKLSWDGDNHAAILLVAMVTEEGIQPMESACITFAADDVQDWARRYIAFTKQDLEHKHGNPDPYLINAHRRTDTRYDIN